MSFVELIRQILRDHPEGMTPQQLRDKIKMDHPDYYGTESHRRNVEKGHYKDLDHALLARIYVAAPVPGRLLSTSHRSLLGSQRPLPRLTTAGTRMRTSIPRISKGSKPGSEPCMSSELIFTRERATKS